MKEIKRYRPDMVEDPNGAYVMFADVRHLIPNEEVESKIMQLATSAEIVREIRFYYGLSQKDLADMVGINKTYISKIESGKAQPSTRVMALMLVKARGKPYLSQSPQRTQSEE